MSQAFVNHNGFFSDYFVSSLFEEPALKGLLPSESEWRSARNRSGNLYRRLYGRYGERTGAAETRERWLFPLLRDLGFRLSEAPAVEVEGAALRCSHQFVPEGAEEPAVLLDLLAWADEFDRPPPGNARRLSPHKRMLALLEATGLRWGILASGEALRLLRLQPEGAGQEYLQFDFPALLLEPSPDTELDFALLWALCRAAAFIGEGEPGCLLDLLQTLGEQRGARVSEELRNSVFSALERLVRGLLQREDNWGAAGLGRYLRDPDGQPRPADLTDADLKDVFRQGLEFLFRCLFVLYAESRGLLPDTPNYTSAYSVEGLRQQLLRPDAEWNPSGTAVWDTLCAIFRIMRGGLKTDEFVVPAYNGGLFDPERAPLLETCSVGDDVMREVVLDLTMAAPPKGKAKAAGRDRISYRELDVEHLGAVYEGLLEYEPKIAREPMVVVASGKTAPILPESLADAAAEDAERFEPGDFYLSVWGGLRKGSGTYYTPRPLTAFLVEKALQPLTEGKSTEEILRLRVLDPAMGSGAFLVAACRYLTDRYMEALVAERAAATTDEDEPSEDPITEANRDWERARAMRLIAERCLYGVDLNPMAVELARVSLWLATLAGDRPLTFLDHHLRCGNSLIGATLADLDAPMPDAALTRAARKANKKYAMGMRGFVEASGAGTLLETLLRHREAESDETIDAVDARRKAGLLSADESSDQYRRLKAALDLWCAAWFWQPSPSGERGSLLHTTTFREVLAWLATGQPHGSLHEEEAAQIAGIAGEIADRQRFFHWELEFPELYFAPDGAPLPADEAGFHAVVGNPPWDIVKPNSQEFFSNYDPRFREYDKQTALRRMEELKRESPEVGLAWTRYEHAIECQSQYCRASGRYAKVGGGDLNTYKLFLERFFRLLKRDGRMGILVPSSLYADKGCEDLRRLFFEEGEVGALYCFENRRQIFPIHRSFRFVAFVVARGGPTDRFPAAFMLHDLRDLGNIEAKALTLSVDLVRRFSPDTLSIMEFKHRRDIEVAESICANHPPLGENVTGAWNVRFSREFDVTNDSALIRTTDQIIENGSQTDWQTRRSLLDERGYLPLLGGEQVHHYVIHWETIGWWVNENEGRARLDRGGQGERVGAGAPFDYEEWRVTVRRKTSSTNERTLVGSILPPRVFSTYDNEHSIIWDLDAAGRPSTTASLDDLAYLNAALSSFCLDWLARLMVKEFVTVTLVHSLPVPRTPAGGLRDAIVRRCIRLLARDRAYADLWESVAREKWSATFNSLPDSEGRNLRAEIEAMVAIVYGLSRTAFCHILGLPYPGAPPENNPFPLVPQEVKAAALAAYDRFWPEFGGKS